MDECAESAELVTEAMAEAVHAAWMRRRIADGWRLGDHRDDVAKLHPCLVAYDELPEQEKAYDRGTAAQVLAFLRSRGFRVIRKGSELA